MSKTDKPEAPSIKSKRIGPPKNIILEYLESFVVTLIMAIFGMTFVIQAVTVPTGSMQNTILVGDYLLVNKFIFNAGGNPLPFLPQREIKRGDIIVFKYPGNKLNPINDEKRGIIPYQINYVKRVIGLPGETVEFRNNAVYINGELLPENRYIGDAENQMSALTAKEADPVKPDAEYSVYYSERTMKHVLDGNSLGTENYSFGVKDRPMKVPENSFFVMGDSRDNSEDSRFWGFVPRSLIVGRAMFVYWSCDRGASNGDLLGCITHPRLSRIGTMIK
ncbi:MAG: signal peptidase I [Pyrinomonadaceae bacterium]|nr:signal peptidase I [Pyrinomonadaceae bacterium]